MDSSSERVSKCWRAKGPNGVEHAIVEQASRNIESRKWSCFFVNTVYLKTNLELNSGRRRPKLIFRPLVAKFGHLGWWQGGQNGALGSSRVTLVGLLGHLGRATGAKDLPRGALSSSSVCTKESMRAPGVGRRVPREASPVAKDAKGELRDAKGGPRQGQGRPRSAKMASQGHPGVRNIDPK